MNYAFENNVAIVTGATAGIGRATAIAFAKDGAKVILAGRRETDGAAVVAEIQAAGGGAIVNNASCLGLSVIPDAAVYNASKFAVIGLTKTAAVEFATQGVRISAVCPAVIETDINAQARGDSQSHDFLLSKHPIGRFGKVDEISAAVLFLCSPGASFTTGIAMPIDGGFTAI